MMLRALLALSAVGGVVALAPGRRPRPVDGTKAKKPWRPVVLDADWAEAATPPGSTTWSKW